MTTITCTSCALPYPEEGLPHLCPRCGGVFGIDSIDFPGEPGVEPGMPGIWRYRASFSLPASAKAVYLGEGGTPLVEREIRWKRVAFKLENLNPSGSFKDRGTAVLTSFMLSRSISEVVEDSSGNAGASLAAYSSAVGIKSRIFVPETASGPKVQQMVASGARVVRIPGPREAAHQAALADAQANKLPYASHALLPMGIGGFATIAYELAAQLGRMPGSLIAPVGHGSLFLGLLLGARALCRQDPKVNLPVMVGVQPANCAPLAARWENRAFAGCQGTSQAEGTQIEKPVRGEQILKLLRPGMDVMLAVAEEDLRLAYTELAEMGFYVEPTSAMVWSALKKLIENLPEPIVLVFSGSGLKFRQS
ncbi:MAG TPA: pyridoxal-phosphate dependent enzyme [Anaerolineaceae bacterium]|nr:pyridoxal-phosphate dependent enzyme [Anaerolineaceae bacterium]